METSTHDPAIVIPILVGVFLLAGLFAWVLVKAVRASLASSVPYREAVEKAQSDSRVLDAMGAPLEAGPPRGNMRYGVLLGKYASLSIPLSGPTASGRLFVRARGWGRSWTYTQLQPKMEGSGVLIDLSRPEAGV